MVANWFTMIMMYASVADTYRGEYCGQPGPTSRSTTATRSIHLA